MGVLGRLVFPKKKIVYTVHGFDSVRKAFSRFLKIEKSLKNKAFCIVGVSQYDVNSLAEESITQNVVRVYNGISDAYKNQIELKNQITESLEKIRRDYPKVVICISRISKQKKFDLFLDVARQLPQYAFVWIGNKQPIPDLPANAFCLARCTQLTIACNMPTYLFYLQIMKGCLFHY